MKTQKNAQETALEELVTPSLPYNTYNNTPNMLLSSLEDSCLNSIGGFSHIKRVATNLLLFQRTASIAKKKKYSLQNKIIFYRHTLLLLLKVYKQLFPPFAHLERETRGEKKSHFK